VPLSVSPGEVTVMEPVVFKGLVHPKMKIKSLITHPHAVPTP